MKTLVLGLGNAILGDDRVGLAVAEAVRRRLPPNVGVEVDEEHRGGLRLMERLSGYDRAILVDALCAEGYPPGAVVLLGPDDVPTENSASSHDLSLPAALRLGAELGLHMPEVAIVAVTAFDVSAFSEELSPAVVAAVPQAVETVLAEARAGAPEPAPAGRPT